MGHDQTKEKRWLTDSLDLPSGNHTAKASFAHVGVYQNGSLLVEKAFSNRKRQTIFLTNERNGDLAIPFYPLPNGRLNLLDVTKGMVRLDVEPYWEGFYVTKDELVPIEGLNRPRISILLSTGDYASIVRNDLRIVIKVNHQGAPSNSRSLNYLRSDWRRSFLSHFFPSKTERICLMIAIFAAMWITGSFSVGLINRPYDPPQHLEDLKEDYLLKFVAPEYLENAPETLQSNLKRQDFLGSVIRFYRAFTQLQIDYPIRDRHLLLTSSVDLFQSVSEKNKEYLNKVKESQRKSDSEQVRYPDLGILSLSTILGETSFGKIQRTIDKVSILQESVALNLSAKKEINQAFPQDDPYDYENYRGVNGGTKKGKEASEAIKKINVWGHTDAEDAMYAQAKNYSAIAREKQKILSREPTLSSPLVFRSLQPIEFPLGTSSMTFADDIDFSIADEKLEVLTASEWGLPKEIMKPKEPLIGEIDTKSVEQYIKQNRYQLQLCYELLLRKNESAAGSMEWRWRIDTRGFITDIAIMNSAIKDAQMIQCIKRKIASWRFPRPRRGSVEISYPFEFNPSKG